MNIRQTSLALAITLSLSFISVISYMLYGLYKEKSDSINMQDSIVASSLLNKAIIELSLERSVMQVTLNLDRPIQPEFRALLNEQRQKSDAGFKSVKELVSTSYNVRRRDHFLRVLDDLQSTIKVIRDKADVNLAKPLSTRNTMEVKGLPPEMKETILSFSKLPIKLRGEDVEIPVMLSTLESIQQNAWAVREFGGRERTYMAIATATGRPIDKITIKTMKHDHEQAVTAMRRLELFSSHKGLSEDIQEHINTVRSKYFGSYEKIRENVINDGTNGEGYSISFTDFFTQSSEALGTAVSLSYLAGDQMVEYIQKVHASASRLFLLFVGLLVMVIALCGFQIYYTQCIVSARILRLADCMKLLTKGNTDIDLDGLRSSDEIGKMAEHVAVFRNNVIEVKRLEDEQKQQEENTRIAKESAAREMAATFEERVGLIVASVEQASQEMQQMSLALSDAISMASNQSESVVIASQDASNNVNTVAAAAEEMSASIQEISRNVADTAYKAKECASSAQISQEKLSNLQNAVEEIDSVIQAINDVAEQTNLLALNATIEAARAGDAGKGFAVVASEVKSLANETHKMTDEIARKVKDIKESAEQTISSVNDIISQITSVDEKTTSVASAIEEQTSTTSEISHSVAQAASGTGEVSRNIGDIQRVTQESAISTDRLNEAAAHLIKQTNDLQVSIDTFLQDIQSA